MAVIERPAADEFAPYYGTYINLVPGGDLRDVLRSQLHEAVATLSGATEAQGNRAYGGGKWTLKEVLAHVCDTERVFSYRLLRIARGDVTPLPGFEQDLWVPTSDANARSVQAHVLELTAVRASTLLLMEGLPAEAWTRRGTASGHSVSARAMAYIAAGHERHHMRIVREKYLVN